jgi:hypothetical protein
LAYKQYISPVRLFEYSGINTKEVLNILRIKKLLVAEFNIAATGFIEVAGFAYTKNDILEELEHPQFEERFKFHIQIWQRPNLLTWLETNMVDLNLVIPEMESLSGNNSFDGFFSPYFAIPFSYTARNLLMHNSLHAMGNLLAFESFLQPNEREEAFKPIRIYLEDTLRTLKNIDKKNYRIMRPKVNVWLTQDWPVFCNNLPFEFYDIKYSIVVKLINISVAIIKTKRLDAKYIIEKLILLNDVPPKLRKTIDHNYLSGEQNVPRFFQLKLFGIIFLIITTVITIANSGGCNNTDDNTNKKVTPMEIKTKSDGTFELVPIDTTKLLRNNP